MDEETGKKTIVADDDFSNVKKDGAGRFAYDLMMGVDRTGNDGGLITPPTYDISGFVWEDADYDGIYNYEPEQRYDADGEPEPELYSERGYGGKKVILHKWYFDPRNGWVPDGDKEMLTDAVAHPDGITGYYVFEDLPTARLGADGSTWYLAGYTLDRKSVV